MMEYPKRQQLYALKYIQWLADSGVANDCGSEALAIVTMVAVTEDKLRYSRMVSFYNDQLCRICGFSEPTLISARKRAVAAGLLFYKPGAKRRPALYFTRGMDSDSVHNFGSSQPEIGLKNLSESHENRSLCFSESHENRSPTIPILSCPKPTLSSSSVLEAFEGFWKSYPARTTPSGHRTKGSKPNAQKQWQKLSGKDHALAIKAVVTYSDSGQIPKDCERWLRGNDWDQWLATESSPQATPDQWGDEITDNDDAPPKPLPKGMHL